MQNFSLSKLVANYQSLTDLEQEMLRYFAVYGRPIGRYQLDYFRRIKSAPQNKQEFTNAFIERTLEKFHSHRLTLRTSDGYIISLLAIDFLLRDIIDRGELAEIKVVATKAKLYTGWSHVDFSFVVNFLESFYLGNEADAWQRYTDDFRGSFPMLEPFDPVRFAALSPRLKSLFARHSAARYIRGANLQAGLLDLQVLAATRQVIERDLESNGDARLRAAAVEWALASGNQDLLGLLDELTGGKAVDVAGCRALLRGEVEQATSLLAKTTAKKASAKCLTALGELPSLFYFLMKLSGCCGPLGSDVSKAIETGVRQCYFLLDSFETMKMGCRYREKPSADLGNKIASATKADAAFDYLTARYLAMWLQLESTSTDAARIQEKLVLAEQHYRRVGCHFLAGEVAVLAGLETSPPQSLNIQSLAANLKPQPVWEQRLQAIADLVAIRKVAKSDESSDVATERLIFEMAFDDESIYLEAFQQSRKGQSWSKGRKISLKRLSERSGMSEFAYLTEQDRAVIRGFRQRMEYGRYGIEDSVEVVAEIAARGLIGHPHVYRPGDRELAMEIVESPPRLLVEEVNSKEIQLRLDPSPEREDSKILLNQLSPGKLEITFFNEEILRLHQRLGPSLRIPRKAIHRLPGILRPLSSVVMVHSEVEMGDGTNNADGSNVTKAEVIEGQRTPRVHLFPSGGGYFLDMFVHPFGESGPSCRPGEGGTKLFANVDGKSLTANRDLSLEIAAANQLLDRCPHARSWLESPWSAFLPTPIDALEVLLELDLAMRDGHCQVMWPQGKELRIAGQVGSSSLQVRIKKDHDWFAASGALQVDSTLSLDMLKLIDLVSNTTGRFVQLDDGRFLALTEQLRRQIEEFKGFGDRKKTGSLRFPAAHAGMFENLAGVKIKADAHWKSMLERMRAAQQLEPKTPHGFLAEMRDYQEDGYKWMARLAAWGVGGCLADDMGLGKTIQALAMLMERATGPALVIAPTSVVFNWAAEIQRFAPTLRPRMVAEEAASDELTDLQPNDVVLCSYGLLQHRTAMLKATSWNTLILDEAQAIKNATTQRSQSAKSLQANFRMIMTGTPIENHLGELWNLMDFINPGMLGSAEVFQQRFAIPIERDQCRQTKSRLKKLISPFLLRRTKAQVLSELPSRTEITLHVTMSPQETAFYEALRQQAVKKLADIGSEKTSHLQILAEIMRLRRACCNPQLVHGGADIECSKLKLFSETVDELLAGGHKALVFSQFVDYLAILRQELERKKIAYQYLDGSTPAAKRKTSVEAFQAGEGDLFLISLKAGGSGLNLTAADYVLHMDPWWNPAVEDQASDRAHRMGQQRPVTIYRFITEGTIEHKIQQLHGTKRDLADSLLEGTDQSGKLSAEELLALLRS
ncbi:MAG: DEAD/DEAH box helicase [Planctomycetaceae bacterium]|nr:DEAD/DEAH box helicase [Planctomycetaceae bacterium]